MIELDNNGLPHSQFRLLAEHGLTHGVFGRIGGVSAGRLASLNVGLRVGDRQDAVEENLRRILNTLSVPSDRVVTSQQVHGPQVALVGAAEWGTVVPATDGLISATPGTALLLRFADCLPLLLYAPRQRAVAIVHSGWRGTVAGIAGIAVGLMRDALGCNPDEIIAGIGPAIGPCCYEVGPDLVQRFQQAFGADSRGLFRQVGARQHLDLPATVRWQLQAAGVQQIESSNICTACAIDRYYSHRAERGQTGRFAVIIAVPE